MEKINYIDTADGKLFSFHRHDYKKSSDNKFIDGGFDYTRSNTSIKSDDIYNLIKDIREKFTWTAVFKEDGTRFKKPKTGLLKDLSTPHILNILAFFTKQIEETSVITKQWKAIHLIFIYELKYRYENDML